MLQNLLTNQYNNPLEKEFLKLFHGSGLPMHSNKTGHKHFTNYQRVSLIILFKRSKKSIRDFIRELKESKWISWFGLPRIPGKSTFHDWISQFSTTIIRKFNNGIIDTSQTKIAAIDGTGIPADRQSRHYEKRLLDFQKKNKDSAKKVKKRYHKFDAIVDTEGKKHILDFSFTTKNRSDTFIGKKLIRRTKLRQSKILADKGYPDYAYADLAKKGMNNFVSPPKNYGDNCKHNNYKRRRKISNFEANEGVYKRRGIVEAVFSSIKRVQDLRLRSKLPHMKKKEIAWQVILYNIRMNVKFDQEQGEQEVRTLDIFFITIRILY